MTPPEWLKVGKAAASIYRDVHGWGYYIVDVERFTPTQVVTRRRGVETRYKLDDFREIGASNWYAARILTSLDDPRVKEGMDREALEAARFMVLRAIDNTRHLYGKTPEDLIPLITEIRDACTKAVTKLEGLKK